MRLSGGERNLTHFKMMHRSTPPRWRPAILLVALAGLLAGCDRASEMVPVLMLAKGSVTVPGGTALRAGERLLEARSLATGADSFAAVSLAPGVVLALDEMSRAELLPVRMVKHDDTVVERVARLRLLAGRAYLRVAALPGRTEVRIETGSGEVRAFGEAMAEIALDATGAPTVTCGTGVVNVSGGIPLAAGFYSVSENGVFSVGKDATREDVRWKRVLALREIEGLVEEIWARQRTFRP